jgi:hypothetical protein
MAQSVAVLALQVTKGEDRVFAGTHQTSGTDTTPINITGWTMKFTVRDANKNILFTKTPSVSVGASGTYTFSVAAADTTINPDTYPCDLWRTDSGLATVMGIGTLTIQPDVRV